MRLLDLEQQLDQKWKLYHATARRLSEQTSPVHEAILKHLQKIARHVSASSKLPTQAVVAEDTSNVGEYLRDVTYAVTQENGARPWSFTIRFNGQTFEDSGKPFAASEIEHYLDGLTAHAFERYKPPGMEG